MFTFARRANRGPQNARENKHCTDSTTVAKRARHSLSFGSETRASRRGAPMADFALFLCPRAVSVAPLMPLHWVLSDAHFCHSLVQAKKKHKHWSARPPAFLAVPCLRYAQARQAVSTRSQLIVETSYPGQDSISIYNMQNIWNTGDLRITTSDNMRNNESIGSERRTRSASVDSIVIAIDYA